MVLQPEVEPALPALAEVSAPLRIVDSQVHIWGANTPQRPWPSRAPAHRDPPWSAVELLSDKQWIMGRGACEWLGWKL